MIKFVNHGNFKKANSFLEKCLEGVNLGFLDEYGRRGVEALKSATPVRTGKTASSWSYKIVRGKGSVSLEFHNDNVVYTRRKGRVSVAILLEYGHGTKRGGYVQGRDFISPAIQPLFDEMAKESWERLVSKK